MTFQKRIDALKFSINKEEEGGGGGSPQLTVKGEEMKGFKAGIWENRPSPSFCRPLMRSETVFACEPALFLIALRAYSLYIRSGSDIFCSDKAP